MDFMNEIEKELKQAREEVGVPCRKNIIKQTKLKLKSDKEQANWTIKTIKRLEKLIRKNPKYVYIYDYVDLEACVKEGDGASWIDVHIALPFSFGRMHSVWVCTILTKKAYENDRALSIENGGEIFNLEDQFRTDQFDNLYLDIDSFKTQEDVIEAFKIWANIFIPELAKKNIIYEMKEAFFLTSFLKDIFQRKII